MIMLLLGLLLLAATGVFAGLAIVDNMSGGPDYSVVLLGHHIATMNSLAIFLSGIALALIFCIGLALATSGGAMMRRRGVQLRRARAEARRATADRDALQDRLDEAPPTTAEGTAPVRRSHQKRRLLWH
jgi:hypothetical protein